MMKLFKIAFLPLLAGILLLPAASRPVRAAGSAAVGAGAGDRKRDKKKKQEADTAAKATPYEKLFKDKRVETVRGGGLTLHLTADKLYLELPDSLLGRGLMITTTIEWTGDPGDGLAHQQPVPPYMVEFGRGKSDTLLCMREFAPVVIVDGSPAMREAVGRSNIGPIVASYAVKARTPDGKSSVVDVTALFVGDVKRLRPIDPEGGNLEMIIKDKGQVGGPLNQFSTLGYKFSSAAKILYEDRMVRVESCGAYSAEDEAN